jgi:hypothetical protein
MNDVVKKLTAALAPSLWVDGNHVDPKKGEQVFAAEHDAIGALMHLRGGSIPTATLQGMIDTLDHADRVLAEDALGDAIAASGDPKKIAAAQEELADAAEAIANGHFADAVEHYMHAWKMSQEAVH